MWARVVKWATNLGHLGFMKLNCNGLGSSVTRVKEPNRTEDFGSWELGTEERTEILSSGSFGSGSWLVRFSPQFSVKFAQGDMPALNVCPRQGARGHSHQLTRSRLHAPVRPRARAGAPLLCRWRRHPLACSAVALPPALGLRRSLGT